VCWPGSLKALGKELGTYRFDFLTVQEVRWDKRGTERAKENTYFHIKVGKMSLVRDRIRKIRVLFQLFREQSFLVIGCHMVLRRLSCGTIILNSHVPTENKLNASNDIFCDKIDRPLIRSLS
jgi:hypothetical protein